MHIEQLLTELSELRSQAELLRMDMQEKTDSVITVAQRAEIAAIEAEYEPMLETVNAKIAEAEHAVKAAVAEHGETVKANGLQAVYSPGRVTWDAKSLDGFAINHPELFAFRKEGKPSVSIRVSK